MSKREKTIVMVQPVVGGLAKPYRSVSGAASAYGLNAGTIRNYLNSHIGEWWTNGVVVVYRSILNEDDGYKGHMGNNENLRPKQKRRVRK